MTDEELEQDLRKAIRAHEAEYGIFQEGDTVKDRDGGVWQPRRGVLERVYVTNGRAP